jgi:hypothetical protein
MLGAQSSVVAACRNMVWAMFRQKRPRRSCVRALALRQQGNAMTLKAWSTWYLIQNFGAKSSNGFGDRLGQNDMFRHCQTCMPKACSSQL